MIGHPTTRELRGLLLSRARPVTVNLSAIGAGALLLLTIGALGGFLLRHALWLRAVQ
jgi:hypothetical protein